MKSGVSISGGGPLRDLEKAMRLLANTSVMVGVPADDEQPHEGVKPIGTNARNDPTGINNATLGYLHEHGAPAANIPARPHLVPGVTSVQDRIVQRLKDAGEAALKGNVQAVEKNFHAVGLTAQSAVRNFIAAGIEPPLKQATVAARRRRTQGSTYRRRATNASMTTPLIDSADYIHSISYVLRKRR